MVVGIDVIAMHGIGAAVDAEKQLHRKQLLAQWLSRLVVKMGFPLFALARLHLVVLVLLKHPELDALATALPRTPEAMFHAAAATEMLERRRETVARLERSGILIVEAIANKGILEMVGFTVGAGLGFEF